VNGLLAGMSGSSGSRAWALSRLCMATLFDLLWIGANGASTVVQVGIRFLGEGQ
jgi:hypothetical protein